MEEKKKLCIGIVVSILASGIISWGLSGGSLGKKKNPTIDFIENTVSEFQYDLGIGERKVASPYKPLDINEIKKKLNIEDTTLKMEEIKNSKGQIIGNKEYKKNGEIIITNLSNNQITSTETIEKEKDGKYQGKAVIVYSDGTKQIYSYKDGVKEGKAEIIFRNDDKEEYNYKNGVASGQATYYFYNGDKEIYNYKNGVIDGDAKYIYSNGKEEVYKYVNGERI